jgi:hypothetical protein
MCVGACARAVVEWSANNNGIGPAGTGTRFTPGAVTAAAVPLALVLSAWSLWRLNRAPGPRSGTQQPSYLPIANQPSNVTTDPFGVFVTRV